MSILLDSLRKSEAQRKIKDAPTIHSAESYGAPRRRSGRWLAPAMTLLTAAAIAWFGWQQFNLPAGEEGELSTAAAEEGTSSGPEGSRAPGRDAPAEPAAQRSETRTPVEQLSQAGESVSAGDPERESPSDRIAAFSAPQESPEDEDPYQAGAEPFVDELAQDDEQLAAGEASTADEAVDDFSELAPPAAERRRRAEPVEAGPRSYWQLPQSWRNEMPEFRISVLVYAEAAENRFLLINGERLREGDELEGGVVLEEIRRDGAVFSYRQTRFLVKS